MTPQQIAHARKVLRRRLPANGRATKRTEMTAAKLSKALGRTKDYIRDFIEGRKVSLGAGEVPRIEDILGLARGELLGADPMDRLQRVPASPAFEPERVRYSPDTAEAMIAQGRLQPGEVIERNVVAGLGIGGLGDEVADEGTVLDGVRAVWRLPVDYLRTELRADEHEVDIFPVMGDSMIPTLLPGDRVMIHRKQVAPSPDGLFAIFDGIGIAIKRLEVVKGSSPVRIRIKSDNPNHSTDEILAEDLRIIGRVICKVTRV